MDFPADVKMSVYVKEGAVFYFVEETFQSKDPHYFVILNFLPDKDEVLVLVSATSQKEKAIKRRSNMPKETLVLVNPSECNILQLESIFDCNSPIERTKASLIQKLKEKKLGYCGAVSLEIVEKLRNGVILSPLVSKDCKHKLIKLN